MKTNRWGVAVTVLWIAACSHDSRAGRSAAAASAGQAGAPAGKRDAAGGNVGQPAKDSELAGSGGAAGRVGDGPSSGSPATWRTDPAAAERGMIQMRESQVEAMQDCVPLWTLEPALPAATREDDSLACRFPVPSPSDQDAEAETPEATMLYRDGEASYLVLQNSGSQCGSGWQYVSGGTEIELCGTTCDTVQASSARFISVAFGCSPDELLSDTAQ
jgi:hypothetical protein